ncbi:restriction endonuclease subunit S [Pedobacter sp. PWIIR3]
MDNQKIPVLRFSEFKDHWTSCCLKQIIITLQSGVSVKSEDIRITSKDEFGILKTSSVSFGKFRSSENKKILDEELVNARLNPLRDTILISRMNTPQLVGESGYVDKDYPSLFIPDRLWMATLDKNKVNVKWLSILLATTKIKDQISNIASGTSGTMKNISKPNFLNIEISIPSLIEQSKIASFLTFVDDKIQLLNKKKKLVDKYKKGVMQKIFNQEVRFKDDQGSPYSDWVTKKAKDIFINHTNKKHNGDLQILAITQDQGAVLRSSIGKDIYSSEDSVKSYKIVEVGDFIISLRSFQGGIEYSNVMGICSPAYTVLKPKIELSAIFFRYYLKKESFIQELSNSVIGIRDGKQISFDVFSGMKLPFPCFEEQTKIANFLSAIDDKINLISQQIENAKEFKKGLLQQMFV